MYALGVADIVPGFCTPVLCCYVVLCCVGRTELQLLPSLHPTPQPATDASKYLLLNMYPFCYVVEI
jgi:hypothetical protein